MAEIAKPLNIYQRMLLVQNEVQTVYKDKLIKLTERDKGYKTVSHDDVAALLHLPLAKAGIVLLPDVVNHAFSEFDVEKREYNSDKTYKQKWYRTDLSILVKWINADDPKDFFSSTSAAYAVDTSDKSFSKAYSLALKIALLKVHLLESRDDEEERILEKDQPQGGQNSKPKPQQHAAKAPQKEPVKNHAPGAENQKPDPADFVITFGNDTKGKKIRDISEATLRRVLTWLDDQLKLGDTENTEVWFKTKLAIVDFLSSVGSK